MDTQDIPKKVRCCICNGKLTDNFQWVQLEVGINWDYPKWGNFLTGKRNQGLAVLCVTCCTKRIDFTSISKVIQFHDGEVIYHPLTWLTTLKGYKIPTLKNK